MIPGSFSSLELRMLHYYRLTMPDLIPIQAIPLAAQHGLHSFLGAIPATIADNLSTFGFKETPDDCYPDFALNKTKPNLIKQMRKIQNKLNKLYYNLIQIAHLGTLVDQIITILDATEDVYISKQLL